MNLTIEQLEILMLESALNSAKEYELRCNRRAKLANEEAFVASQNVIKMANQLEAARQNFLRRTV